MTHYIYTLQLYSTKPDLRLCAGSNKGYALYKTQRALIFFSINNLYL